MDFFNKAKEKIAKTSGDVAKKAKDLAEVSKLNGQINANENSIKALYTEIGQYVFENLREDAPAEIAEKMNAIDKAREEIASWKNEVMKLKGIQKCAQCGGEVDKDVAFCPSCGAKMPEPVVEVVDAGDVKEVVEEAAEAVEEAVEAAAETVSEAVENVAEKVEE